VQHKKAELAASKNVAAIFTVRADTYERSLFNSCADWGLPNVKDFWYMYCDQEDIKVTSYTLIDLDTFESEHVTIPEKK
jgi:hypothetical protein